MSTNTNVQLWGGRIATAIPVIVLLMSASMKIAQPPSFVDNFKTFGFPINEALPIGIVELLCTIIYLIPQTSVLGAILLTGYLGGAVATHVRVADPAFAGPLLLGVLVWVGLYFRDARIRALVPLLSR